MRIVAENYGSVIILNVEGSASALEMTQLLSDMASKCTTASYIVVSLEQAAIPAPMLKPLLTLREQQRYLKPRICVVSPTLDHADAKNLGEVLRELDVPEAGYIGKYLAAKSEHAKLSARKEEVEKGIQKLLALPDGYDHDAFTTALAAVREKNRVAKLLAAAIASQVAVLKKTKAPVVGDVEAAKETVREIKSKAYIAIKGD